MSLEVQLSSILKQGFRFAIGAALVEAYFWHQGDVLDNFIYPVFGYVSVVIEPTTRGAFNAGLGRVAGSALGGFIAAILVSVFGINGYSLYVIAGLTFILASLICETYRWQAAYSQATLIGTLIAMRALGTSAHENIWLYLKSRLVDNWIGICFGIAVVLLIYPQDSRRELNKYLNQFLENLSLLLGSVSQKYLAPENTENTANELIKNLKKIEKANSTILSRSTTEFRNIWLEQEKWIDIVSSQKVLLRQAQDLLKIVDNTKKNKLSQNFSPELTVLPLFISQLESADLELEIEKITKKLDLLRQSGKIDQYSTSDVLSFFQFLQILNQFSKELKSLKIKLKHKEELSAESKLSFSLLKYNRISYKRILEIIGIGIAIAMSLSIIHHINFPFPSAYQGIADVIIVGSIVMIVQPTRGQALAISIAAMLSLYLTIFFVYLMAKSFGFSPLTSGIVFFLIYVSCSILGFPPLARIGAIVAADVLGKDIYPFFDQGIVAALVSIPIGIFIALMITTIFMQGSVSDQLESGFSRTFVGLGQLYQSLLNNYFNPEQINQDNITLKNSLTKEINMHTKICKIAGFEQGAGLMGEIRKKQWNLLINFEQQVLSQLNTLEDELQQPMPDPIRAKFLSELQEIVHHTSELFIWLSGLIIQQKNSNEQIRQTFFLNRQIKSLEERLLNSRLEMRNYKLEQLISFSSAFITLKEIAENLEQISETLENQKTPFSV